MIKADYFKDYDYKKHCKLVAKVYVPLILIDMTVSYFLIKKIVKDWFYKENEWFENLKLKIL